VFFITRILEHCLIIALDHGLIHIFAIFGFLVFVVGRISDDSIGMGFLNRIFIVEFDVISIDFHYRSSSLLFQAFLHISELQSVQIQGIFSWKIVNFFNNFIDRLSEMARITTEDKIWNEFNEVLFFFWNLISIDSWLFILINWIDFTSMIWNDLHFIYFFKDVIWENFIRVCFSYSFFVIEFYIVSINFHDRGNSWLLKTLFHIFKFLPVLIQWIFCWQFLDFFIYFSYFLSVLAWIAAEDEV